MSGYNKGRVSDSAVVLVGCSRSPLDLLVLIDNKNYLRNAKENLVYLLEYIDGAL